MSLLKGIEFRCENENLNNLTKEKDKKKKKSKKKKTTKKKAKKKKTKKHSGSSSSSSENEVVPTTSTNVQREAWMTMPLVSSRPKQDLKLSEEEEKAQQKEVQKQLEIDQGIREPVTGLVYGLYDPKGKTTKSSQKYTVGDAGKSYRESLRKCAQEKALETGQSVEEVIDQQYGSILTGGSHSETQLKRKRRDEQVESQNVQKKRLNIKPPSVKKDINKLAALALRAKMLGDKEAEKKYINEINEVEAAQNEEEGVVLTSFDEKGRMITGSNQIGIRSQKEDLKRGGRKGKLKSSSSHQQKECELSVQDLVRQEKQQKGMDEIHVQNILRLGDRYQGTELGGDSTSGFDEEDQVDAKMYEHVANRLTEKEKLSRERRNVVKNINQWDSVVSKCRQCMKSTQFQQKKHLMISLGEKVYLSLPTKPSLTTGHCVIVPVDHLPASNVVDEEIWQEIVKFKQSLYRMFRKENKGVIFLEKTAPVEKRRHTFVECIPVPLEVEQDAALYFRQGLNEVDEEWSTHKKIINTHEKGIRRSVPANFPYFHCEWASGGYAHIIEDERQFPQDFGVNIIAGMMEIDPPKYGRERNTFAKEKETVLQFLKNYEPFDWTRELDGGEFLPQ